MLLLAPVFRSFFRAAHASCCAVLVCCFCASPIIVFAQSSPKCLDIAVKTVRLIAIETNRVRVEVTLENRGLRTFDLPDSKTLGLQYYWSGDSTYNPGDQIISGTYIKDFGDYANKLSPDGVYSLEITVPTTKKTRFSNYLVVIVDSFFNYDECNENNNVGSVSVIVD